MNPELLTCRRLTAGLLYQPMQIQPVDLNRLYVEITERYPYQSLQHLPDGIRMSNAENDCFIQAGRVQVNEEVMYFPAAKEKCIDIFQMVHKKLNIQQYLTFGVKLTAFLPMDSPRAAAEFIESNVLKVQSDEWDLLGPDRKGTGLRIVIHQQGIHDIKIEPFFNDLSQLYVELDIQHPQPISGLECVEEHMDAAYEFMFTNIKNFLGSLR